MPPKSPSFRIAMRSELNLLLSARDSAAEDGLEGKAATFARIAHHLSTSAKQQGAHGLARAAARLERASATERAEALADLIASLEEILATEDDEPAMTVLFLEDDPDLGFLLLRALTDLGVLPLFASTIAEAKKQISEKDIDLVLMDLGLPDDDGRGLPAWLREQPMTARVPVVVLTSNQAAMTKQECFALGADEYIEKPVDLDVLASTLARHLRRSEEQRADLRHDRLTGLLNQRASREEYARQLESSVRSKSPLCFGLLELEGFTDLRARLGRSLTNEAVQQAIALVQKQLSRSDILGLWEPGEFVVLMPGRRQEEGAAALEAARQVLLSTPLELSSGEHLRLDFSAGVVDLYRGMMIEESHGMAGRLLYVASVRGGPGVLSPE